MSRNSGGRSSKNSDNTRTSKGNRSSSGSRSSGGLGNKHSTGGFSGGGRTSGGFSASGRTSGRSSSAGNTSSQKQSTSSSSTRPSTNERSAPVRKPDSVPKDKKIHTPPRDYHEPSFHHPIEEPPVSQSRDSYHVPPPPRVRPQKRPRKSIPKRPRRQINDKYNLKVLLKVFGYFLLFYILASILMNFLGYTPASTDENIPNNTTKREPLQGIVMETDWYEDELGWIHDGDLLIDGLGYFYSDTGIQPYIVLMESSDEFWQDSFHSQAAYEYLEELYDQKFSDESHLIFAYFSSLDDSEEEVNGEFLYLSGSEADKIMDEEALTIFWANFEKNYYDTSLSIEEMIANTFETTARSIMNMPMTGWDVIKVMIVIGGAYLIIRFLYRKLKAKNQKKEENTEMLLNQPLKTFGIDTTELEKKYK